MIAEDDWLAVGLIAVIAVLVWLPSKYDPAIRLKEWAQRPNGPK